jgi:hypothetical protein
MGSERASERHGNSDDGAVFEPVPVNRDPGWLREDLLKEYFALVDVVVAFDARVMTVKGWSVTLSLVGLGLGFQQNHYSLFALAAATGLGFWLIEPDQGSPVALLFADARYRAGAVSFEPCAPAPAWGGVGATHRPAVGLPR